MFILGHRHPVVMAKMLEFDEEARRAVARGTSFLKDKLGQPVLIAVTFTCV